MRRATWMWALAAAALASACHCGTGPLGGSAVGFTVSDAGVDFGRVLQGTQEGRSVTLVSAGNVDLTVAVATSGAPFSVPSSTATVPRGGQVDVAVVFDAGATVADGTLELSAHGQTVSVPLHGVGVAPLVCTPSAICIVSTFDLASGTCVESQAADGTGCDAGNDCLDTTVCKSGQCLGSPRDCSDGNPCTNDSCSPALGCIHTDVQCPPPSNPCLDAFCDPSSGCTQAALPDGTICGAVNCVTADLCFAGGCQSVSTPDGVPCAPATPCRDGGTCEHHQCVVPDAGDLTPSFTLALARVPVLTPDSAPALLAYQGNLFWTGCSPGDAGCALESCAPDGFERFEQPFPDGRARWLVAVTGAGVVLETGDALEAYDQELGTPLWSLSGAALPVPAQAPGFAPLTGPGRATVAADGTLVASFSWWPGADAGPSDAGPSDGGTDGGPAPELETFVRVTPDGGLALAQAVTGQGTQSLLGTDTTGVLDAYDPAGPLAVLTGVDGGWQVTGLGSFSGLTSLALAEGTLLVGATTLLASDGGTLGTLAVQDGGAPFYPQPRLVLAADEQAYLVQTNCAPPLTDPCADVDKTTYVTSFDLLFGSLSWTAVAAPSGLPVRYVEGAIVLGGGAVATVMESSPDAGTEQFVQVFAGQELFACRVPPTGTLGAALFDSGTLYLLIYRAPTWWLEAYPLAGVAFETSGWPQRNGTSGTRTEQP